MNRTKNYFIYFVSGFVLLILSVGCTQTLTFDERFAREAKRMESELLNYEKDGIKCVKFTVDGKELTIRYVTLNQSSQQIDPVKFSEAFKEYAVAHTCKDSKIKYLLKNGVVFKYQYFSNDEILINETVMDRRFCGY